MRRFKLFIYPFIRIIICTFLVTTVNAHYVKYLPQDSIQVINAGIGGNTTVNLLSRLNKDCLRYKPDLIILMIGTNDMVKGNKLPLTEYKKNLSALVDTMQRSGSKVLLMTILPFYEPYLLKRHSSKLFQPQGPEAKRKEINDIIKQVSHTKNTYLLDLGKIFEKIGQISEDEKSLICNLQNSGQADGVHPTSTGYRFLAVAIYSFITGQHISPKEIVCFGDSITKGIGAVDHKGYPEYLQILIND